MAKTDETPPRTQLTTLAWIGLLLWIFFAGSCAGSYSYYSVPGHGGIDTFTLLAAIFFLPYLLGSSLYIGFFMTRFAEGRWKYPRLWGIAGFVLTLLSIIGFPSLVSPVFPDEGPAMLAPLFLAPVLSALLVGLLISIRKKATV